MKKLHPYSLLIAILLLSPLQIRASLLLDTDEEDTITQFSYMSSNPLQLNTEKASYWQESITQDGFEFFDSYAPCGEQSLHLDTID